MFLRRLLTYIFIFFACLASYAQVNQVLWGKGKALYANPIATIDSLTYGQLLYGDTLYIIFDRESKRIVYDTIHVHMPGIVFHDTIYTTDTIFLESGRRIGVFSVAADKQVTFSQGNLQYTQSTDTWQFANEQWECIGAGNIKEGALADKIDLFGWSANNTTAPWGISLSSNNADYAGAFVDWGENIINSDVPNTWRTLTNAEWEYLRNGRNNAQQLIGVACVNGINGLILLPDACVLPDDFHFTCGTHTLYGEKYFREINDYTFDEWFVLQQLGAVFLPASGICTGVNYQQSGIAGSYYSASPASKTQAYIFNLRSNVTRTISENRHIRRSVRLVHDTIVPEVIPDPCFVVKVNDTLSINMMCVEGGTFMMGAMEGDTQANANEKPAHEVTLTYDYYIGQTEVTQALWKAVMGYNPSTIIGDNLPVNNVLWGEAQAFVYKLNQITGLSFDLPTEAEWEYAARGGKKSKGYLYAGSNNLDEVAWYNSNSGGVTHPVAQKMPNELGIYDMSGNVWEWCSDWLAPYTAEAQLNPTGPATGECHVYHGGGWTYGQNFCRSSHRRQTVSGYVQQALGLRVVLREKVEPEYVDLGLSVKWATFNVGATSPEDYGDYFAWGEIEPKETYSWANYKWCQGTSNTLTKYCSNSQYGNADYKTILDPEDDAAIVHWGSDWRMPTIDEWLELKQKCSWKKIIINGITGYQVTAKNGNSIFLPRAGLRMSDILYANDSVGYYASSNHLPEFSHEDYASYMLMYDNTISKSSAVRYYGLPIRPVYDDAPAKRIGVFSVAADKQVSFSQGNLQYTQSTDEWRFAREQHEYIGAANIKDGALADKIDLFGWSANNTTAPFGVSTSTNVADYAGTFVDWGTNVISGDASGIWRTLSADEWEYLFEKREKALQLRSKGSIDGHRGHILLPDDWVLPEGVQFVVEPNNLTMDLDINSYTQAEWRIMEEAGAIFLPAAGRRDGTTVGYLVEYSGLWSSTSTTNTNAFHTYYNYESQIIAHHWTSGTSRINGRSVRLVHDTIVPEVIPEPCLVVKVNDTLSINMMCVEGGTFTMGDGENAHPVSLSSFSIGQTEVTQALWEAVMGTNPSANTTNKQLPVTNISWYDCQEFINRLNQLTGLRFRLPTEAEWEYAARGGQKSKGYTYAGSNDLKEVAWYNGNSGNTLHAVAQKKPNELGIYDMSGNAWEWCHDWHAPYPTTHQYNPLGPEVGQIVGTRYLRVFRGGSYGYAAAYHQNTFRDITGPEPDKGTANLGLRLVLSDEINFQTIHVNDTLSFHMMDVKGGTFTMGDDNISNASPAHQVTLSDYYIGETEVTQTLWKAVMGDIPTGNKNPSNPVGYVSYADCQNFIAQLNNLTGLYFQLPTEAEWEYAAMGGNRSHGYLYSGSNTIDDVAWYDQNSGNKMHNVGAKQPNELGIYDMSGNAWEWCADYHGKYTAENQINPQGPATRTDRVLRSGSFRTIADRCTNKHRQARDADYPDSHITLRLVLHDTVPVSPEPEYVDLGLSVKWATFNVGATSPEDYGDYFAWGETEPKETYSWATYKWGTSSKLTKYNTTDGKTILDLDDDAAYVNWGGKWRMPSKEEVDELTQQCNWIWTTHNNVNGYKVTGPNGNSIFLPAAGYKGAGPTYPAGEDGLYWTNTIEKQHYSYLIVLHDDAPPTQVGKQGTRCFGFAVRAVYGDRPPKRIGVFSVAADKQVSFSRGNLQYTQSTDEWRFAREQYDYLGEGNLNDGQLANRIDLFGWSASGNNAPFGVSTSTDAADYTGEFVDWGTNTISGDEPNTWRTLSIAEWEYLLEKRPNAANLQGIAQVNGVNGLIILPDDWVCPLGIHFVHGFHSDFGIDYFAQHQQFTLDQWIILEQSGAVFLPASKWRNGSTFTNSSEGGHYWSSTCGEISTNAHYLSFGSQEAWMNTNSLHRCFAVRLVHDTIVPETIPDPCLVVKVNDTLSINMMCVEGGTMYIGRGDTVNRPYRQRPLRQVTISDFYLGQTEVTQELWLAVMGENPTYFPCDTCLCHPVDSVSIDEVLLFIERLNSLTGYNFRLPTEAEWEYAARGGMQSKGYAYAGSDNRDEVAWYGVGDSRGGTPHPVAQKRPNELGLYDMHGNLWEFVHDKFVDDINIYPSVNPTGPEGMRGSATGCGSAYYSALMPENTWGWVGTGGGRSRWFGFRLALSDQDPFVPITIGKYRFHMMYVQGGTFMMGSDAPDAEPNEKPVHEVILSDYYIGQTEVTQKLWKLVMGNNNNPSANKGDELPVTNITWDEAQVFVEKLSEMTGLHFRLPTEAEWEYAARGGQRSEGYTYAGSDDIDEVGWYNVNSANKTHNVGQKMPNELGIYDMTGNVWEWCAETFDENNDGQEDAALYGGAWDSQASTCRVISSRAIRAITYAVKFIGFRLVHDADFTQSPEPEYVDLGLSVKWATFNVGATSPEDYGDYFAWGETEPKETYSWATYKWCDGTQNTMTKYNATDGKTILDPEDDVAQVLWGGKWRMPTKEELQELIDSCQWERATLNDVVGNKITGPNGNSIFIPAAGSYNSFDNQLHSVGSAGWLYSSSAVSNTFAREINIGYSGAKSTSCSKCLGLTIRPVYDDRPPKRIGVFSVAADKQVSFSQGNLQYTQSTDEWRFAREQYEYIGADNIQNSALADKIDLFGWSSDSGKAPFGISTSQTAADYMGQFVDWGVNEIQGDAANTWRTLSQEEWNYIFENRKNAKQLYSKGSIDGVRGMIVLPDDWVQPQGLHFTADPTNLDMNLDINVYTAEQWQKMEEAGAVFLCPTGRRDGTEIGHTVWYGGYWSSSRSGEHVKHMYFNYNYEIFTTNYSSGDYSYGYNGRAVRLVHDTIVPPPAPCQTFKVNGVTFNMMCVEGEMYDYKIAQTEVTQGLWEQVMGYNNSLFKGEYLPVEKVSWEECQTFIQKLNEMTGKHFRLPTEAEWEYAARGGKNSRGYTYAGSNSIDSVAWYQSNSQEQTHTIATLMPNELGIYDMSGNVWEWCQDYYDASTQRVVRGGSFYDVASVCRISSRSGRDANYRSYIGLRLVLDEHEYVDLGLSVKWATTNVGAESAEDYGDYFAWGETEPKEEYSWATYKWCDGTENSLTKYCTNSQYGANGFTDNKTILEPEDDAARVHWGDKWRMPTDEEMTELREKCTWTWISINGVDGYEVTGPSGKSIFLPATGFYFVDGYKSYGNGDYWSTKATTTSGAYQLYFNSDHWSMSSSYRYFGFPIRPVYDDR